MTPFTTAKLIFAACGLIVWGYGIRTSQPVLKWIGIVLLACAVVLRLVVPGHRRR